MNRTHRPARYRTGYPHALWLAGLCLGAAVPAAAQTTPPVEASVQCADGKAFLVELAASNAVVHVYGRDFVLQRRSSTLPHYSSEDAALIIDGDFVAFVMTDALNFNDCHLARGEASAALPDERNP